MTIALTINAGMLAADDSASPDSSALALPRKSPTAEPKASPGQPSLTRTAAALAGVLGGVVLAVAVVRRFIPGLATNPAARMLQVLGQSPLGARATVYVVRCGPRVLILGVTAGHVTTLAEIADPDEITEFARLGRPPGAPGSRPPAATDMKTKSTNELESLKGQVDGLRDKVDSWKA